MTTTNYDDILKKTRELELAEQLQLLQTLVDLVKHQVGKSKPHSIMELEGLGADIWQGIDAQNYVNEERASWES